MRINGIKSFFFVVTALGFALTTLLFQNCGKAGQVAPGALMSDEEAASAADNDRRELASDGSLLSISSSCEFNGLAIANGGTVKAYQNGTVATGQSCVSETRVCSNSVLSGSYNFASCSVNAPKPCLFNGITVKHNSGIDAYRELVDSVSGAKTCEKKRLSCNNGFIASADIYPLSSCVASTKKSCLFNGKQVLHGATVVGFKKSSVSFGNKCEFLDMVCNDGTLNGMSQYPFAACSVGAAASCNFFGRNIASGQSVTAFQKSVVTAPSMCKASTYTCSNGTFPFMPSGYVNFCDVARLITEGPYFFEAPKTKVVVQGNSIEMYWNGNTVTVDGEHGFVLGKYTYYIGDVITTHDNGTVDGYKHGEYKIYREIKTINPDYVPVVITEDVP